MAEPGDRGRRRAGLRLRGQLRRWPHRHRDRGAVSHRSGRGLRRDRGGRATPAEGGAEWRPARANGRPGADDGRPQPAQTATRRHHRHRLLRSPAPPGGPRRVCAARGAASPAGRPGPRTSSCPPGAPRRHMGNPGGGLHRSHCERVAHRQVHRLEGAVQVRRRRGVPAAAGRAPVRHVRGRVHARGGRLYLRDARHALRARRSRAPRHRGDRARHRLQGSEVRAARGLRDRATDRRHREAARGGHRAARARRHAVRGTVRGIDSYDGRDRRSAQDEEVVATVTTSLRAFLLYFLRLGTLGFGGPIALAGHMQQDLVEQRGWISAQEYKEGLAFAQLAPGPLAAQLAIYLGWVRGQVLGATLVGIAFVAPSFLMVLVLSDLYVRFGGLPWMQGLFYGIGAAVIAIIARSVLKLVRMTLSRDQLLWILFAVSAVVTAWTESEIIWVFLVCGLVPMLLRGRQRAPATHALAFLPAAPGLATGLAGPASVGVLWKILAYFAGASLFVFGSGLAIVPFLYGGVVQQFHWLTERQFIDAVAVLLITPGPVVITVAFIGYLVAGLAGATLSAIGVFLPVYLITVLLARRFHRVAKNQ